MTNFHSFPGIFRPWSGMSHGGSGLIEPSKNCELSKCLATLCQKVGRSCAMQVNWLVKPDEKKSTAEKRHLARSVLKRDKPACGAHLSFLSTAANLLAGNGQTF